MSGPKTPGKREPAPVLIRRARMPDLPAIVRLLADDEIGRRRESSTAGLRAYRRAFREILRERSNQLVVVVAERQVIGTLQLTMIPNLTYQGGKRALIEGVRVDRRFRDRGIGKRLFEWAIGRAKERGCRLVQLTTDKRRPDARRFYERLGFVASHEGMKLHLPASTPTWPSGRVRERVRETGR